jgi:hypothetical protein
MHHSKRRFTADITRRRFLAVTGASLAGSSLALMGPERSERCCPIRRPQAGCGLPARKDTVAEVMTAFERPGFESVAVIGNMIPRDRNSVSVDA